MRGDLASPSLEGTHYACVSKGVLTPGSPYSPRPSHPGLQTETVAITRGFRPQSQWRGRAGFTPASLYWKTTQKTISPPPARVKGFRPGKRRPLDSKQQPQRTRRTRESKESRQMTRTPIQTRSGFRPASLQTALIACFDPNTLLPWAAQRKPSARPSQKKDDHGKLWPLLLLPQSFTITTLHTDIRFGSSNE